jgi:predicted Zn-dependent protease
LTQLQSLTANDALASYQTRLLRAELDLSADQLDDAAQALMDPPTAGVATPRAQMLLRASLWLRQGRTQEATQQLQLWVSNRPGDALAWQLLSSAYTAQKNTLRAIRADAEAKVAQLDYPAARDRLRAAQDVVRQGHSEDHIEASIIDARARELDAMTREQSLER